MKLFIFALIVASVTNAFAAGQVRVDDDVLIQKIRQQAEDRQKQAKENQEREISQRKRYLEATAVLATLKFQAPQLTGLRYTKYNDSPVSFEESEINTKNLSYFFSNPDQSIVCQADSSVIEVKVDPVLEPHQSWINITCLVPKGPPFKTALYDQQTEGAGIGEFNLTDRSGVMKHFAPVFVNGKIKQYRISNPPTLFEALKQTFSGQNRTGAQ